MSRFASCTVFAVFAVVLTAGGVASAQSDGEGVDSQLLWASPGPSAFATLASSDILGHKLVSFGAMFDYYRRPLALEVVREDGTGETLWVVEHAATADFMWAFGIANWVQVGVNLPVVLDQAGVGATPLMPEGVDDSTYKLAGAALKDLRFDAKVRFLGKDRTVSGFGLAADVAMSVPTGDELNFAGEKGFVFAPNLIADYRWRPVSIGVNAGARLRTKDAALVNLTVGHQMTAGIGITGRLFDDRFLLGAEGTMVAEMDGFDRLAFEYRGSVGYVPDKARSVTLWISGGASGGTGDLLGTPKLRFLLGLTYAPKRDEEEVFVPEETMPAVDASSEVAIDSEPASEPAETVPAEDSAPAPAESPAPTTENGGAAPADPTAATAPAAEGATATAPAPETATAPVEVAN